MGTLGISGERLVAAEMTHGESLLSSGSERESAFDRKRVRERESAYERRRRRERVCFRCTGGRRPRAVLAVRLVPPDGAIWRNDA